MPRTYNFLISQNSNDLSLKKQLEDWLIPKRIRGKLRQDKRILVNSKPVSIDYQLKIGDQLRLELEDQDFSINKTILAKLQIMILKRRFALKIKKF